MSLDPRPVLPITDLSPARPPPPDKRIHGVVTLLWPYSSSSRSCALLLGDPDFRLRTRRGQVRIRFAGPCAVAVAKGRVGIGDHVELGLKGAEWVPADEATVRRTPGKSVEGELAFGKSMELRVGVEGGGEGNLVKIEEEEIRDRSQRTIGLGEAQTPERRERGTEGWISGSYGVVPIYSSPAFVRRARLSAEGLMGISPFGSWDEVEDRPRKKPRFSMEGIKNWTYTERSPSPEATQSGRPTLAQDDVAQAIAVEPRMVRETQMRATEKLGSLNDTHGSDSALEKTILEEQPTKQVLEAIGTTTARKDSTNDPQKSRTMQPPPLPSLQLLDQHRPDPNSSHTLSQGSQTERPSTPKIQAIASETLPLPSPFPNDASHLQSEALHSSTGSHTVTSREGQHPQSLELPHDTDHVDVAEHVKALVGERSASSAQENFTAEGQNEGQNAILQQEYQNDDSHKTHEDTEEASILQLTYLHDLSDTEEDDDEIYTNRFTQETFDSQHVEARTYEDVEDATEDDADGESQLAAATKENDPQLNTQLLKKQTAIPASDPPLGLEYDRELSAVPTASVSQDVRREIARSEWSHKQQDDRPQTPMRGNSPPHGTDRTDITPRKPTPQSEKDRIMAQTYRSLFGFGDASTKPVLVMQATGPQLAEARATVAETEKASDELLRETDAATEIQREVVEEHQELQSIQEAQNASHSMPGLISNGDNNEAIEPINTSPSGFSQTRTASEHVIVFPQEVAAFDARGSNGGIENSTIQDSQDENRQSQATTSRMTSARTGQFSEQAVAAHAYEDSFQDLTQLSDADMSFPSTTAVATDYLSPTEPVSFERMQHPEVDAVDDGPLSFASNPPDPEVDPEPVPNVSIHTATRPEQAVPIDESHLGQQSNLTEAMSPGTDAEHCSFPKSGELGEASVKGDELEESIGENDDEMVDLTDERQDTKHAVTVRQSLPVDRDLTAPTVEVIPYVTSRSIVSQAAPFETAHEGVNKHTSREDPMSQRDEHLVGSGQAAGQQLRSGLRHGHIVSSPNPFHSQEQVHSHALVGGDDHGDLRSGALPPTPQLTQGESPMKGANLDIETSIPETPKQRLPPESEVSQGISQTEFLDHSPSTTLLRRSSRASRKPRRSSARTALAQITEKQETSPSNKTPERLLSRKSQTPVESEPISVSTPSIKATPTRRSSRLQAHTKAQASGPGSVRMETSTGIEQTSRLREPSKTLFDETSVKIGENAANVSILEDIGIMPVNSPLEPDVPASAIKLSSRSEHLKQTPRATVKEPAYSKQSPNTSAKKSAAYKSSTVPDVISHWFSPRRSSRLHTDTEKPAPAKRTLPDKPELRTGGIATSSSYYTPLSKINEKLNTPSQSALADSIVDILAVAATDSGAPERAKSGPRDYHTVFDVTDPSLPSSPAKCIRVEVFRPWHAKLPVAQTGDVVLLRAYAVKSRKHQPYLLSTDASAWCVWRYGTEDGGDEEEAGEAGEAGELSERPPRATKRDRGEGSHAHMANTTAAVREEVKGPPVEFGEEERLRARELREWWLGDSRG